MACKQQTNKHPSPRTSPARSLRLSGGCSCPPEAIVHQKKLSLSLRITHVVITVLLSLQVVRASWRQRLCWTVQ